MQYELNVIEIVQADIHVYLDCVGVYGTLNR